MLKRADAFDVDAIVSFEADVMNRRLYGQPLDHAAAASEVQANEYFMDLRHARIVATGAWRRRDDGTAYLSNIAVRPELRRQGVARAMIAHLLSCCGGAAPIDLAVHPDNDAARALYASLGFKASKRVENYFGDGEPRLIMVRSQKTTRAREPVVSGSKAFATLARTQWSMSFEGQNPPYPLTLPLAASRAVLSAIVTASA